MTPEPDLQVALDAVYAAFRHCRRPVALDAAPSRDPKRILADLTARPLTELTADNLGGYMGWAMTTVGSVGDYKHFLPRILELSVLGPGNHHIGGDPEGLARKIMYGAFPDWSADERAALVAAFDAAWRQTLNAAPQGVAAEDWLRGLIVLGEPIQARLAAWLASDALHAGLHLADAVYAEILRRDDAARSFGPDNPYVIYEVYSEWLASPPVRARLERLILNLESQDDAWRLEMALDVPMAAYPDAWRG
jgi:hypothetical protein